jgi:hypothetical protein
VLWAKEAVAGNEQVAANKATAVKRVAVMVILRGRKGIAGRNYSMPYYRDSRKRSAPRIGDSSAESQKMSSFPN